MQKTLNPAQQEDCLKTIVGMTLDNFSMASLLAKLLITYEGLKLPPPAAKVLLRGQGPPADIPGTNCGFFVTPVFNMACLDCRRSLEFFGLTCNQNSSQLTPITKRRRDDLGIEHFGLALVSRAQFIKAASSVVSGPIEPVLTQVHAWSNKQLAHFTISEPPMTLRSIRDMSMAMIEAYIQLLFSASGRPRPGINPSPD
jgi:hypothetical protein